MYLRGIGEDETQGAPSFHERFDALDAKLVKLNETAEKDLFFRKISTAFAVVGAVFAAAKIVDVLTYLERRRAAGAK